LTGGRGGVRKKERGRSEGKARQRQEWRNGTPRVLGPNYRHKDIGRRIRYQLPAIQKEIGKNASTDRRHDGWEENGLVRSSLYVIDILRTRRALLNRFGFSKENEEKGRERGGIGTKKE